MKYSAVHFPFIISAQIKNTGDTGDSEQIGVGVTTLIRNNEIKLTNILTKMVFLESSLDEILDKEEQEKEKSFLSLIPIFDNLDAACNSALESENPELGKGLEIVKSKLLQHYSSLGLTTSAELGMKFDPRFHEAVDTAVFSTEPGLISDVIVQGWLLAGKVLRFAKVIITT